MPSPAEALLLTAGQPLHDIAEFYSPPRVLPSARMRGLVGCFSLDLLTGWDLMDSRVGALARQLLETMAVQVLILSPPLHGILTAAGTLELQAHECGSCSGQVG